MQLQGNLSSSPPPGNNSQSSASSSSATNSSASAGNSTGSDDGRYHASSNGNGRHSNQPGVTVDGKVLTILSLSCALVETSVHFLHV